MSARHPLVAVYADESCLGNGKEGANPGGAGVLIEWRHADGRITRRDLWISEPATTNNRMALRSVTEAFRALGAKDGRFSVRFTTDSRYIVDGMTGWVFGWARNGWTRKTGAIENLPLWFDAIASVHGHEASWQWVKGHAGHPQNEYANDLAVKAATEQTQSGGLVPSGFEAWLAARRAKGGAKGEVAPFPDGEAFTPSASLPRVPTRSGAASGS
ncbi:MAG: ribonuclease HI [Gemmatimonadaceae bacterium]|nr:ribonuclease HI [Gemmatimonadaceae bacterium]